MREIVEKHFSTRASHYTTTQRKLPEEKQNPLLKEFRKYLKGNEKILDVGCGAGFLLASIRKNWPKTRLYGIDLTPRLIEFAKKEHKGKKINFSVADALNLPFKEDSFDVIVFKDVLHHIVGKTREESKRLAGETISEITRVLKRNGLLIFYEEIVASVAMSRFIFSVCKILNKLKISIPFLYLHPHTLVSFLTEKELEAMLKDANFKIIEKRKRPLHMRLRYKITIILPLALRNAKNLICVASLRK